MTSIKSKVEKLKIRRRDLDTGSIQLRDQRLAKSTIVDTKEDAIEYLNEVIIEVEEKYTIQTFEEGRRVQAQLAEDFSTKNIPVTFDFQGSVTNGTHIRLYSDIDLLVLTSKYHGLKQPLPNPVPYSGNPLDDLSEIRKAVIGRLTSSFYEAKVDSSGAKSVAISGGSLRRKIDVVPANWLNTQDYINTGNNKIFRGVEIFDSQKMERIENYPFLHNYNITQKDMAASGNLKKLIRLVKSIKEDSDQAIDVSSYTIVGIAYLIDLENLKNKNIVELGLSFVEKSIQVLENESYRKSILVPNGKSFLFLNDFEASPLLKLNQEILSIIRIAKGS